MISGTFDFGVAVRNAWWPGARFPKLVLLDRDGVINEDVGAPGVTTPSQLNLIKGAGHAIARLKQAGCSVAMVTNQSCVGKGIISEKELGCIQTRLQELLYAEHANATIDKIFQCTATRETNDPRMKPQPGMIFEAMRYFGVPSQHKMCCFIGDTSSDLQAAAAAGVEQRILVATGYGKDLMEGLPSEDGKAVLVTSFEEYSRIDKSAFPFVYCSNLGCAVDWILDEDNIITVKL